MATPAGCAPAPVLPGGGARHIPACDAARRALHACYTDTKHWYWRVHWCARRWARVCWRVHWCWCVSGMPTSMTSTTSKRGSWAIRRCALWPGMQLDSTSACLCTRPWGSCHVAPSTAANHKDDNPHVGDNPPSFPTRHSNNHRHAPPIKPPPHTAAGWLPPPAPASLPAVHQGRTPAAPPAAPV